MIGWRVIPGSLATGATITVVTAATAMAVAISVVMMRMLSVSHLLVPLPSLRGVGVVRHAATRVATSLPPAQLAGMQRWGLLVYVLP